MASSPSSSVGTYDSLVSLVSAHSSTSSIPQPAQSPYSPSSNSATYSTSPNSRHQTYSPYSPCTSRHQAHSPSNFRRQSDSSYNSPYQAHSTSASPYTSDSSYSSFNSPPLPATPTSFAHLFPSRHRLAIRLADALNLVVSSDAAGPPIQLFHLRLRNLTARDFSLRRYARDSGREVCSSTQACHSNISIPSITSHIPSSITSHIPSSITSHIPSSITSHLPSSITSHIPSSISSHLPSPHIPSSITSHIPSHIPSDPHTIRLEFTNYARIHLTRRSRRSVRYTFEWWGRKYAWRRAVDKTLASTAWHLECRGVSVAHLVPDVRSPSQRYDDERAGVWIPPAYLWISDQGVVDAVTDVADVIVATGLIALVDDSILSRWPLDKPSALSSLHALDAPIKSGLRALFSRKHSADGAQSPLRGHTTVAVC